jgi:hypothetical protein
LLVEAKVVPRQIYVRSPILEELVAPLGKGIRTTVTRVDELPGIDRAKKGLIGAMRSR